jgi:hypothetical protein
VSLGSGEGSTHVTPVHEGHALRHAVQRYELRNAAAGPLERLKLTGRGLTLLLENMLNYDRGYSLTSAAERDQVRLMKELHGFVAAAESQREMADMEVLRCAMEFIRFVFGKSNLFFFFFPKQSLDAPLLYLTALLPTV